VRVARSTSALGPDARGRQCMVEISYTASVVMVTRVWLWKLYEEECSKRADNSMKVVASACFCLKPLARTVAESELV